MEQINNHKCIVIIILLIRAFWVGNVEAQTQFEFSSSINPIGSGARATGMGGAFIGIADDATAASWNPAGLIQLENPEISGCYSYFSRNQIYSFPSHPEAENKHSMDSDNLNYAGIVYPFTLFSRELNMVVSLNYQRLYEMNKEINFSFTRVTGIGTLTEKHDFIQDGSIYALSPAAAFQITPGLSIGAAVNFYNNALGRNGWDNTNILSATGSLGGIPIEIKMVEEHDISFEGINANLGFLWSINSEWTLGGVYKTPFDADLEDRMSSFESNSWMSGTIQSSGMVKRIMRMPSSYGLGVAYRYSDNWTISMDAYRTEWSRFVIKNKDGSEINPISLEPIRNGRLKDTTQVRLGTEYLVIRGMNLIPFRFGVFYDPEPETGALDDFYGFSVGSGFANQKIAVDAAYQFRTANDVSGDIPREDISADIDQHVFLISLIFYL